MSKTIITCYIENENNYTEFKNGLNKMSKYGDSNVIRPKTYPACFIHRHNSEILIDLLKEAREVLEYYAKTEIKGDLYRLEEMRMFDNVPIYSKIDLNFDTETASKMIKKINEAIND